MLGGKRIESGSFCDKKFIPAANGVNRQTQKNVS
jgi:hypothetical protein